MVPIFTQTVGAGASVSTIVFNNIPSTYTDLLIRYSSRENGITGTSFVGNWIRFNGDSSSTYSDTYIYGSGSSSSSTRESTQTLIRVGTNPTGSATANTFSNTDIYIPNYTASIFKQIVCDSVAENNATFGEQISIAGLWRNTAAINSITLYPQINYTQYSTFTLYGIKNA